MYQALAVIIGYGLGSVPIAAWVGRAHGVDLLGEGDRNPGAWNALALLGPGRAAPVFLGDGLKGLLGGLAGLWLAGKWGAYAGVAGAMIGHSFPVFSRFRGGKSVMAFAGGAFALSAFAATLSLAACLILAAAGSPRWGARVGVFSVPLAQLAFEPVSHVAATGALMTFIGVRFLADRIPRRRAHEPAHP